MDNQKGSQNNLLKNMPDGFAYFQVLTDEKDKPIDYICLQVNPAFTKLTGFDKDTVLGEKLTDFYPGLEKLDIDLLGIYNQLLKTGKPVHIEIYFEYIRSWLEITVYLDKPSYVATVFKDITNRKKTEEALRDSESKHRFLAENASDVIWTTDLELNYTYISPSAERISGYSLEEILTLSPAKILTPSSFKKATELLAQELTAEQVRQADHDRAKVIEVEQICKDGSTVWVELNVSFIRDQDGNPAGLMGVTREISARKKAEEKLLAEKHEKEVIINNLSEQVTFMDPEMRVIWTNAKVKEQHDLDETDYKGQICYDLFYHQSAPCPDCPVVETLQTGKTCSGIHKSPDHKFWQVTGVPIHDQQGLLIGVMSASLDITDLVTSQQALQESYSLLRIAGKTARFGGWSLDLNTNQVSWSDQVAIIHEMPVDYSPSINEAISFYAPEWRDKINEVVNNCVEKSAPFEEELEIITAKGHRLWVRSSGEAVKDEKGNIVKIQGSFQDISEQKKIEAALRESEERLDLAMTVKNEGLWDWNLLTNETFFDNRYYTMAGYQPEEFPQHFASWTERVHPDDLPLAQQAIENYLDSKTDIFDVDFRFKKKDGQWMWINGKGMIFGRASDGKPLRMVGTHTDITERKKAEEALKLQARERAAVDTFTYSVSHDLQAPLRRIEGFSEMLLEEFPDQANDNFRDYLKRIITQISSMKALTDALRQLSKIVSHDIEKEEVNLSALTRSQLDKLKYKEPGRRLEAIVEPKLIAEGDTELLNVLLANLLDNAWKFTAGLEKALIEFGSIEQDGCTIYYLKDNGAGFDMSHADKLFIPFHKLHSEKDYPGIGIGLNLVYRIISRHGGEVWAEGKMGEGATFFFTLP